MTVAERSTLIKLWAQLNVLCGMLAPDMDDSFFNEEGQIVACHKQAVKCYSFLVDMLDLFKEKE
jgi:hypothetical protein